MSQSQQNQSSQNKPKNAHIRYPFWFGGSASCCAAAVTHPLDLLKVRLQTQNHSGPRKNMAQTVVHIIQSEGVPGLYRGLTASLLRQMTYSTTRFGVYEVLKERVSAASPNPDAPASFLTLVAMSSVSGFLGGIVGNPADILNVRMQNDASLPPTKRFNYAHALDGMARMAREEGLGSLFRGVWPNSTRAVLMTVSQLASYDIFKRGLIDRAGFSDNMTTHFSASFLAGFVATTVCSPVDVIKTRIMSAASASEGVLPLLARVTREEGWAWMFRGWVPSFMRLGPHTIATFLFLEQHKKLYRRWKGVDEDVK